MTCVKIFIYTILIILQSCDERGREIILFVIGEHESQKVKNP